MKRNEGFTLIELLAVIIIMTVILGIGIPSVVRIIQNKGNDEANTQIKLAERAVDLYMARYKGKYEAYKDNSCFIISYDTLISEGLLEEHDVKCTGNIKLSRKGSSNSFSKEFKLNCIDKSNRLIKTDTPFSTSECPETNEADPEMPVPTIKGGNNNWTENNITISVASLSTGESLSNYKYQYYLSTDPVLPSMKATPVLTGNNGVNTTISIETQGSNYIWIRAVDKDDPSKVSNWSNRQEIHIDKSKPSTPTIIADDGILSGQIHTSDFILEFDGGNSPSGNTYHIGTTPTNLTPSQHDFISIPIDTTADGTTYYVVACNKTEHPKCSDNPATYVIKK